MSRLGIEYPPTGRLAELCEDVIDGLHEDREAGRPVPTCVQQVVGIIVQRGLRNSIFIDVLETRNGVEVREAPLH